MNDLSFIWKLLPLKRPVHVDWERNADVFVQVCVSFFFFFFFFFLVLTRQKHCVGVEGGSKWSVCVQVKIEQREKRVAKI